MRFVPFILVVVAYALGAAAGIGLSVWVTTPILVAIGAIAGRVGERIK